MAPSRKTCQTIALIASCISITCACGIPLGPQSHFPPPSVKRSLQVTFHDLYVETKVGTASDPSQITLRNISDQPVELERAALSPIRNGNAFHLTTTCGDTLAPDATCLLILTFTPSKRSSSEARLLFGAKPSESYGLIVEGRGLKP